MFVLLLRLRLRLCLRLSLYETELASCIRNFLHLDYVSCSAFCYNTSLLLHLLSRRAQLNHLVERRVKIPLTHGSLYQLEVVKLNLLLFFHLLNFCLLFVMISYVWLFNDEVIVVVRVLSS